MKLCSARRLVASAACCVWVWPLAAAAAGGAPPLLEPAPGVAADGGCVFGRFKLHIAPLDLNPAVRFVLTLRSEAGDERAIPFARSGAVEAFAIGPGRWTLTRIGSTYQGQFRDAAIVSSRSLVVVVEPGRCHYLGDFAALVSLKQLETVYSWTGTTTPYTWGLASAEDRFDSARSALNRTAFPSDRLDSRFLEGVFPTP